MAILVIDKMRIAMKENLWLLGALLAMFCFAGITIIFELLSKTGTDGSVVIGFMFGIAALLGLPFVKFKALLGSHNLPVAIGLVGGIGVIAYVANVLQYRSIGLSPNPGYPAAIIGSQVIVVSLLSFFIFKSVLTTRKFVGILLCSAGMVLVII